MEKIILCDLTHMMSMADPLAIVVKILRIDSRYSLKKEFTKLIHKSLNSNYI